MRKIVDNRYIHLQKGRLSNIDDIDNIYHSPFRVFHFLTTYHRLKSVTKLLIIIFGPFFGLFLQQGHNFGAKLEDILDIGKKTFDIDICHEWCLRFCIFFQWYHKFLTIHLSFSSFAIFETYVY